MLSQSRIYLFGTKYKGERWFDVLSANELSGMMANNLKSAMPELEYKNIQFINTYVNGNFSSEIHINKLKYKGKRVVSKKEIRRLYKDLTAQLKKINNFEFNQLHTVNDEFSKQPSEGFMKEDLFYV